MDKNIVSNVFFYGVGVLVLGVIGYLLWFQKSSSVKVQCSVESVRLYGLEATHPKCVEKMAYLSGEIVKIQREYASGALVREQVKKSTAERAFLRRQEISEVQGVMSGVLNSMAEQLGFPLELPNSPNQ